MSTPKTVRLFNTLTRDIEVFSPRVPGQVGVYCCGPTVYNYQHIGNLKTYIFEDILVRTLRYAGYNVTHVMNITDVGHLVSDADEGEDKMMVAMKRENKKSHEIAAFYTGIFFDDCEKLHIKRPDVVCKATDHIPEMIDMIRRIEANGLAYVAGGNVYFDVAKCSDYGRLAKLDLEKLQAGARVDVDSNKKSPFDFALWFTKSKFEGQELVWDSPWGTGYPGWHIECSAMSVKYLGENFDIHCGGIDHIPVHHTNEIAQTEAATGKKPWVNLWMHSEFILLNKEKMSKSKGGFITLSTLAEGGFGPEAYRYFCLTGSYRSQLNFSDEALQSAQASVNKLKNTVLSLRAEAPVVTLSKGCTPFIEAFDQAICNDLNTPQVLASVWGVCSEKSLTSAEKLAILFHYDQVLGLGMEEWRDVEFEIPASVLSLVNEREAARGAKNWAEADRLRQEIGRLGFSVEDKQGKSFVRPI